MKATRDRKTGELELQPDEYVPHGPVSVRKAPAKPVDPIPKWNRQERRISGHIYASDGSAAHFGPASEEAKAQHGTNEFMIRHIKVRIEP